MVTELPRLVKFKNYCCIRVGQKINTGKILSGTGTTILNPSLSILTEDHLVLDLSRPLLRMTHRMVDRSTYFWKQVDELWVFFEVLSQAIHEVIRGSGFGDEGET